MTVPLRARLTLCALASALVLSGCGGDAGSEGTAYPSPTVSETRTPYAFDTPPPISTPALTADGLGPIRLGTPAEEAMAQGWAVRDDRCRWRTASDLLAGGVELHFADDRVSEVWLGNATHSTAQGARVGMRIEQVETLYAGQLEYQTRASPSGRAIVPIVRRGDHELLFFGLGDKDATPGPQAPLTAIVAQAYGTDLHRPSC